MILKDLFKLLLSEVIVISLYLIFSIFREDRPIVLGLIILEGIKILPVLLLSRTFLGFIVLGSLNGLTLGVMELVFKSENYQLPLTILPLNIFTTLLISMGVYGIKKSKLFFFVTACLFVVSVLVQLFFAYYQDLWLALQSLIY